jgi:hypothetical protein
MIPNCIEDILIIILTEVVFIKELNAQFSAVLAMSETGFNSHSDVMKVAGYYQF